jgi:hypothetical protein
MLDFTEQEALTTSLPKLSVDTPIVSGNHRGVNEVLPGSGNPLDTDYSLPPDVLAYITDLDAKAAAEKVLAPYRDTIYTQDDDEPEILD